MRPKAGLRPVLRACRRERAVGQVRCTWPASRPPVRGQARTQLADDFPQRSPGDWSSMTLSTGITNANPLERRWPPILPEARQK